MQRPVATAILVLAAASETLGAVEAIRHQVRSAARGLAGAHATGRDGGFRPRWLGWAKARRAR